MNIKSQNEIKQNLKWALHPFYNVLLIAINMNTLAKVFNNNLRVDEYSRVTNSWHATTEKKAYKYT